MPMINTPFEPDETLTYEQTVDFFAAVAKVSDIDIVALLRKEFDIRANYVGDGFYDVETSA